MINLLFNAFAPGLIDAGIKASLLLLLLFPAAQVIARHRPAWRCLIWTTGLVALLLLPITSALLPALRVSQLQGIDLRSALHQASVSAPISGLIHAPLATRSEPLFGHSPVATRLLPEQKAILPSSVSWIQLFVLLYLAGLIASLARIGMGIWHTVGLRRGARPVDDPKSIARLNYWRTTLSVTRPVGLALSGSISVPTVFGIRRPLILLPEGLAVDDTVTLDAVLVHELSHLKRRDPFWNLITLITSAFYWCHPLVHLARRALASARECACDDWAVEALRDVESYAHALLKVAARLDRRLAVALNLDMARPSQILYRIDRMLASGNRILPSTGRFASGIAIAAIVLISTVLGILQPAYSDTAPSHRKTQQWIGGTSDDSPALVAAAEAGNQAAVQALLKSGADVNVMNSRGMTPLMAAAQHGFTDIAKRLLENGADVNAKGFNGWTALMWASQGTRSELNGRTTSQSAGSDLVTLLLQHGADVHAEAKGGATALGLAVTNWREGGDITKALLAHGADIGELTSLEYFLEACNPVAIKILVANGVPVDARDDEGRTPLMRAAGATTDSQGRYFTVPTTVKALVECGADVNAKDNNGIPALNDAVFVNDAAVAEYLLDHGASANVPYRGGNTPLMVAVINHNVDLLQVLLEHGADVKARNISKETALDIARKRDYSEFANLLEKSGAK